MWRTGSGDSKRHGIGHRHRIQEARQGLQIRQFIPTYCALPDMFLEARLVSVVEASQQVCSQQLMEFLAVHRSTPISSRIVRRAFTA